MSTVSDDFVSETYPTRFGDGLLLWRGDTLSAHFLPGQWSVSATDDGQGKYPSDGMAPGKPPLREPAILLRQYFAGRPVCFPPGLPLAWESLSPFAAAVAAALAVIPYGETRSYSRLAAEAGYPGAQRAVGTFLARNPFPVILPCHRVIRADGGAGEFSAGRQWKRRLLEIEGFTLK